MAQDLADLLRLGDYGKNPHRGAASAAGQRIDRGAQPSYTWAISLAQVDRLSLSETFSGGIAHHLLDGTNAIGVVFLEMLEVQLFDELGQGQFLGFLFSVGQSAKLLGIQPQFSIHLDVGMGKMITLPRIDPTLVLFGYLFLLCQRSTT